MCGVDDIFRTSVGVIKVLLKGCSNLLYLDKIDVSSSDEGRRVIM